VQIKPRFSFKRSFKNIEGQEVFETTPIETPNVHSSYTSWAKMRIVNDIKEELLYVAQEPLAGLGANQSVRTSTYELPDGTSF